MIGQTFGNYRVTGLLGEGGMGVVYVAEHPAIGRRAAVKVLRPGLTEHVEITKRFFNEARAANAIRHPGIVEVFDSGTLPSGVAYLVMELLEGESLAARLRRVGRLPQAEARVVGAQTASAVGAAHAAGIVHRDLKPDNLFLIRDYRDPSRENVKVLDFGIAKLGIDTSQSVSVKTRTGSVMGTPAYMSPEQCRGTKEIDYRTDIYALGVILYEMLTGRPPFVSEGFGEMVHLHISATPASPRTHDPSIPADLEQVIMACLAKEPDQRPQTMAELEAIVSGRPATLQPRPAASAAAQAAPAPVSGQAPAPHGLAPTPQPTTFTHAAQLMPRTLAPARRRRGRAVPLVVVALCLGGGGVTLWRARAGRPIEAAVPAPTAVATAPAVVPATVKASIVTDPPGARVVRQRDGAVIGMTPFREEWPRSTGIEAIRLELNGYRPESMVVPLDRGVDLLFSLRKATPAPNAEAERLQRDRPRGSKRSPAARPSPPKPATPAPAAAPKPAPKAEPVPL
jgi:tRNA A-37 threonylcarbamoyl transferase component Bud32